MTIPVIEAITNEVWVPTTQEKLTIKQMRTKDEKVILTAKAESGDDAAQAIAMLRSIMQVVQNCTVTPNVDIAKLAGIDVEWLFIKLRELSVSNKVEAAYRDNEEMTEYQADVEKWNEKKLGKPPPEPEPYKFEIDLSKISVIFPENISKLVEGNGYKIHLRYPPASLYASKDFVEIKDGVAMLDRLIKESIASIDQGEKTWSADDLKPEEWQNFIDELPIALYNKLKEFLANMPYLFYEIKYTNRKGNERSIKLTRLTDFFIF